MGSGQKKVFPPVADEIEQTAKMVIDAAFRVHTKLGAGLLESVYETCLAHELGKVGALVETQLPLPIVYDNIRLDGGFRLDMLVNKHLIVEIKAADLLTGVHRAQLLTYLKLTNLRLGLLINFNVEHLHNGIRRIIN
jgi:GxxExxY protein